MEKGGIGELNSHEDSSTGAPMKVTLSMPENILKQMDIDEQVIARIISYNSKLYVDIRKFWRNFPTKKGIRISLDNFVRLSDFINKK
jgi:hypothetical protein